MWCTVNKIEIILSIVKPKTLTSVENNLHSRDKFVKLVKLEFYNQ